MLGAALVAGVAFMALGIATTLAVAFVVAGVSGVSRSLLEVSGQTLLQRVTSTAMLARVFAFNVPEPRLVILGAGHVGRALAKVAKFSGYRVIVADDRAEYANREWIADADEIVVRSFEGIFRDLPVDRNTYIVIATRGHAHDIEALKGALVTEARYIGLLGSRRKRAVIFRTLGDEGFSKEMLDCVVTPVGLPIGSITPEEIAISIVAQVIQYRRGHALSGLGDSPRCGLIQEDGTAKTASLPRQ
jgi:xanthine dehydrogenase accessory factor